MSEDNKLARYKTTVDISKSGKAKVRYYDTDVVTFTDKEIVLDTGGWWTRSTKLRMNQASLQFNLDYLVCMKGSDWHVVYKGKACEYTNNRMRIIRKTGEMALL